MTTALVLQDPEVAALLWLNEAREELGLVPIDRLPRGIRHTASRCPLARGLTVCSDQRFWYPIHPIVSNTRASVNCLDFHAWDLPTPVQRFIFRFDNGDYPYLEVSE